VRGNERGSAERWSVRNAGRYMVLGKRCTEMIQLQWTVKERGK